MINDPNNEEKENNQNKDQTPIQKEEEKKNLEQQIITDNIPKKPSIKRSEILSQIERSLATYNSSSMSPIIYPPEYPSNSAEPNKVILNYPLCSIGLLKSDFGNGVIIYGTATLIASNIILTAAHLFYDLRLKKKASSSTFYLNAHNGRFLSETEIETFTYTADFEHDNNEEEDYAIGVLKSNLGKIGGYLGICQYNEKDNVFGYLYGYKSNKNDNFGLVPPSSTTMKDFSIYGVHLPLRLDSENRLLLYVGMTTFNGMDGSPVFRIKINNINNNSAVPKEDVQIFAIDSSSTRMIVDLRRNNRMGHSNQKEIFYHRRNKAIPLTIERYSQIMRWMNYFIEVIPYVKSKEFEEEMHLEMQSSQLLGRDIPLVMHTYDFSNITRLNLSNNSINFEGIKVLVKFEEICNNLIELNLSENYLDEKAAMFLSKGKFESLEILDISINILGVNGIMYLSEEGDFYSVENLDVSSNDIGNDGIKYLVNGCFENVVILTANDNKIDDSGAYRLSKGNLKRLAQLHLKSNKIGDDGILYLSTNNLKKLDLIDVEWNNISPDGLYYLAGGTFSRISTLNVTRNRLGFNGAMIIATKSIANIKSISIGSNDILTKGAEMIGTINLFSLEYLDIRDNYILDLGAYYISSGVLKNLRHLNISLNQITHEGAKYIAGGVFSQVLLHLDIGGNLIKDPGLKYICNGNLTKLQSLNVGLNQLTQIAGRIFASSNLNQLKELIVERNELNIQGVRDIIRASFMPNLTMLNLAHNNINDGGVEFLSKVNFKNLEIISLKDNNLYDKGVSALVQCNLENLVELNLEDNNITKEGVDAISQSFLSKLKYLKLKGNKNLPNETEKLLRGGNLDNIERDNGITLRNFSKVNTSVFRYYLANPDKIDNLVIEK